EIPGHQRALRRVLDERVSVSLELSAHERIYRLRAHPRADGLFLYLLDVTEKRDLDRLEGRASELEKSNVQLERFAYVVAHDLQEPLRTIGNYTQLLEKRFAEMLGQDDREFLGYITGGVGRMQVLLRDLLDYSRVDLNKQRPGNVDCDTVVQDVLLDLNAAISAAGATVQQGALPVVRGDRSQLAQVFRNLVGNALKFAAPERPPRVEIHASRREDQWVFEVRDNGIGIAQASVDQIFLLFKRLHSQDDYPGTGLGLAISRRIVERHGGRIWATSLLGQGSSFFFTLPVSPQG
ncbi:MAG TPA: ATP-binding protein, partial [Candidatus Polarisedimenticolaceae bacterium]|nr:ATP-binding protein [Candidatus Polarisedimenticolaceae bacterium]